MMEKEVKDIIDRLKIQYADDEDALEMIDMSVADIEYIEKKQALGAYKGQTPLQYATSLESFLFLWF